MDIDIDTIGKTNKFIPQLQPPWTRPGNWQCYTTTRNGGISLCWPGNTDSPAWSRAIVPLGGKYNVLPNCVGYAYGRALEAWGTEWRIPLANAGFIDGGSKNINYPIVQSWSIPKPVPGCLVLYKYSQHIAFCEESDGTNFTVTASNYYTDKPPNQPAEFYVEHLINNGSNVFVLPPDVSFAEPYDYLVERRHELYGDHNSTYEQEWIWKDTD